MVRGRNGLAWFALLGLFSLTEAGDY
jgi:hypothetical protein